MTALHDRVAADTSISDAVDSSARQPYEYVRRELVEPDWRRFPGWRDVTEAQWRDAQWQRVHCVKNVKQLRTVLGDRLAESFYEDLVADQERLATMSMLLPPQMLNTMAPTVTDGDLTKAFLADPVRRYMMPVASDREPLWPNHPHSSRDSLHEAEMWVVEGLTHRYPTKVLAELLSTCPQSAGTAPGWTWSATRRRRSTSTSSR